MAARDRVAAFTAGWRRMGSTTDKTVIYEVRAGDEPNRLLTFDLDALVEESRVLEEARLILDNLVGVTEDFDNGGLEKDEAFDEMRRLLDEGLSREPLA